MNAIQGVSPQNQQLFSESKYPVFIFTHSVNLTWYQIWISKLLIAKSLVYYKLFWIHNFKRTPKQPNLVFLSFQKDPNISNLTKLKKLFCSFQSVLSRRQKPVHGRNRVPRSLQAIESVSGRRSTWISQNGRASNTRVLANLRKIECQFLIATWC